MVYGKNTNKNVGYLKFDTGKKIKLSEKEYKEFELWVKTRIYQDRTEREK